ncbi:cytoskeletal protein binding protein [Agyrium rufum]|nr:cytoskeletal protein binding protein [Agyrium rufum]
MVFVAICRALYSYTPQDDAELAVREGNLLYITEKSAEDDWWKATKKASGDESEDPVGLVPKTYLEEAPPTHYAKALYDYTRQTEEELSFSEDADLHVYDTSDPEWTLVGRDKEYGFAPANYIEITGEATTGGRSSSHEDSHQVTSLRSPIEPPGGPASALAGVMRQGTTSSLESRTRSDSGLGSRRHQETVQYTPEASDDESQENPPPFLPQRHNDAPPLQPMRPTINTAQPEPPRMMESPPHVRSPQGVRNQTGPTSPGGFHLYNINEMASALGKKKKLPTTLGINLATGTVMIAPEKSRDGPSQEWTAEKLINYSIEGKHVFLDLVKPSKSIHFHAGAKDTAVEIVSALGEIAGASRAEGLREVIAAGTGAGAGQRKGQMLYEFMAQGEDEVTVAVGDDVIILDDTKSEEWWMIRRVKNGKEGVVPSSYVEITGVQTSATPSFAGLNAGRSTKEQNRLEEEQLTKAAIKESKKDSRQASGSEARLPQRASSLSTAADDLATSSQRPKHDSRGDSRSASSAKPKPDATKIRTWTDRSGSFKVEAQFIGLKDGKIHLHKMNGVKIAVPVVKMAVEDLEYVEQVTGQSLDEDKPLSDIRRKNKKLPAINDSSAPPGAKSPPPGASVTRASTNTQPKPSEYDWFDFFLKCGVNPYQCERYAYNFNKDSMDDTILPDISPSVLRTLGLKEGDILRVMKHLDTKFERNQSKLRNVSYGEDGEGTEENEAGGPNGSLFSGPGGALKNNTRKGRPAPAVQTNSAVDPAAFQQKTSGDGDIASQKVSTPLSAAPTPLPKDDRLVGGFDDDAWDVKPSKHVPPGSAQSSSTSMPSSHQLVPASAQRSLTGGQAELSLLSTPLQPVVLHKTGIANTQQSQHPNQSPIAPAGQQVTNPQSQQQQQQQPAVLSQQAIPSAANPTFFAPLNQGSFNQQNQSQQGQPQQPFSSQSNGLNPQLDAQHTGFSQPLNTQQNGFNHESFQAINAPRGRPQPPSFISSSGVLSPPPRPLSAPQHVSQHNAAPLVPHLTGASNFGYGQPVNQTQTSGGQPSLNDISRLTLQNQYANQQHQFASLQPQVTGFSQGQNSGQINNGLQPTPTGFGQNQQYSQLQPRQILSQPTGFQPSTPFLNGQHQGSPFADPRPSQGGFQPSFPGFPPQSPPAVQPQATGINSYLQPALQPQPTGIINGFNNRPGFGQNPTPPPLPPIPQQLNLAPLIPQKTGPAPPVSFGTQTAKKLTPQPTGRRANLSQASA